MDASNPYASPETHLRMPEGIRLRDQQIFRQLLLYSIFYFVGLACRFAVGGGVSALHLLLTFVVSDFASIYLPELIFALVPYVVLRFFTIGRFFRPLWWSFCIAGVVTYPYLNLYCHLLIRDWDTPSVYENCARALAVVCALLTELLANILFSKSRCPGEMAERNAEPEAPDRDQ
jgi:hypothetical protein